MNFISSTQCRAARAILEWSQPELARRIGMHVQTISAFENGTGTPTKNTLQKITNTLEHAGIEFLSNDGVSRCHREIVIFHNEEGIKRLFDDIYETVSKHKLKEVLIANNREPTDSSKDMMDYLMMHLERLKEAGITEKILSCENDYDFLGPESAYRWVPKNRFCDIPTFIYGDKIALLAWDEPSKAIIINNPYYAASIRNLFMFAWDSGKVPPARKKKTSK